MKLYEVPNKTYVRIVDDGDLGYMDPYFFDHIDGMYSYCTSKDGCVVHLFCGTEVEIVTQMSNST